jgi:hypothetical protein
MLLAAFCLLGAGALEVMALIPNPGPGLRPMSQSPGLVGAQVVLAVAFVVTAGLCAVFVPRLALAGAVIAAGIVMADAGLVVADFGGLSIGQAGLALWLLVAALGLGAGGAGCGLVAQPPGSLRGLPGPGSSINRPIAGLTLVAAVLLGVALIPSWDRYDFVYRNLGRSVVVLDGDPFAAGVATVVAVGTVMAAFAFAAVPVAAVLLRPARAAVLLTVGVVTVACSQVLSALIGIVDLKLSEFFTPVFTPLRAAEAGAVVRGSLTIWFDVEVVAAVALLVLVVARWWTPSGGSLFDSYPVDVTAAPASPVWIEGSTAVGAPGTIGYGAVSASSAPGRPRVEPLPWPDPPRPQGPAADAPVWPAPPPAPPTLGSPPDWPR